MQQRKSVPTKQFQLHYVENHNANDINNASEILTICALQLISKPFSILVPGIDISRTITEPIIKTILNFDCKK